MTLSEFNERTNAHLTEDQYKPVENMYNEAGNIQKDQFCPDRKKHVHADLAVVWISGNRSLQKYS